MKHHIFVLMSFRIDDKGRMEPGRKFWMNNFEDIEDYLEKAGKPVSNLPDNNAYYDDPCEHRWDYIVVEKVFEGPISHNEVMGWWKGVYADGRLRELVKLNESPFESNSYNFTEIG